MLKQETLEEPQTLCTEKSLDVEFEYQQEQVDDLLTQTSHYLEFKQISERFDQNEAKVLDTKDTTMLELDEIPEKTEK